MRFWIKGEGEKIINIFFEILGIFYVVNEVVGNLEICIKLLSGLGKGFISCFLLGIIF